MLTVTELSPNVARIEFSGKLTRADIEEMEAGLKPVLERDGPLGCLLDMTGLSDITGDAIAEDMRYEFAQIHAWTRIRKIAVIGDKEWITAVMRPLKAVLPMMDIRVFPPAEAAAAEAHATELPDPADMATRGLTMLESGRPDLLAFEIDGTMTEADMEAVMPIMQAAFAREGKVNLLARIARYDGFSPEMLLRGGLWKMEATAMSKVNRYAIVGGPGWLAGTVRMLQPVMPVEMKLFDREDESAAWEWVREGSA